MASIVAPPDVAIRFPDAALRISCEGDRTVIWLSGEHDIATVFALTDALAKATAIDDADLIVDLSGVTFMGAATIDVLVRGHDHLRLRSRWLTLRSPSRSAMRVLDLCGLAGLIGPVSPFR